MSPDPGPGTGPRHPGRGEPRAQGGLTPSEGHPLLSPAEPDWDPGLLQWERHIPRVMKAGGLVAPGQSQGGTQGLCCSAPCPGDLPFPGGAEPREAPCSLHHTSTATKPPTSRSQASRPPHSWAPETSCSRRPSWFCGPMRPSWADPRAFSHIWGAAVVRRPHWAHIQVARPLGSQRTHRQHGVGWGCPLEPPCVASLCGLAFLAAWWPRSSKRAGGGCRPL